MQTLTLYRTDNDGDEYETEVLYSVEFGDICLYPPKGVTLTAEEIDTLEDAAREQDDGSWRESDWPSYYRAEIEREWAR